MKHTLLMGCGNRKMIKVPIIDHNKCTLCGNCIEVCPKDIICIADKKIEITGEECLLCSHCYSVCTSDAISFDPLLLFNPAFQSFSCGSASPGAVSISPGDLVNFIRSRRSIRSFSDRTPDDRTLKDLVEFAVTSPSGSNCQNWEFTVVSGRQKVWDLAMEIKKFFISLNKAARNPLLRYASAIIIGKALIRYHKDHMDSVELALRKSDLGIDLLFHSAPALIIIHSAMDASTPVEDAQFAAYNIALLAHSLGMGTCYIGYAVESINRAKAIKRYLGLPAKNRVHAVLAIGYPNVLFHKPALRKRYPVNFL